ncbi:MAG: respiratory nitrate reductase subunit gamma [Desulfobacteraceae bacterium]|nr:respiratory nitrate reductase subunit gamma [Desulfobacteraceae bacterium]
MHEIYTLASGVLVWIALIVFVGGTLWQLTRMALTARKKDAAIYHYFSFYYALRSILHWIIPFASKSMRDRPVMTLVAFIFHICLIITPIFLAAHVILIAESWGIGWAYLPNAAADIMTILVILGCIFFLARRIVKNDVRYLSTPGDYVLLLVVAAPFITGLWAYNQWYGFEVAGIIHMLSGELMLICLPFTRLFHMALFPFTRGYAGSETGSVRRARDW